MMQRKKQLAAAVGAALFAVGTAAYGQAAAPALQVQVYGQFSRALMWADDGHQSKLFHVDAQPSSTRFGLQGISQAAPGLRVGGRIEAEMKSNPSDTVNFTTPSVTNTFAERWLDVWFEMGFGRIEMGQGSGAADDASTIDLSGTGMANGNCTSDWAGGVVWRTTAGGTLGTTDVKTTHACNDFESRHDRIRYITPVFGGFKAQVGQGQRTAVGESTEASLWWAGKAAGDLSLGVGYSNVNLSTPAGVPDRETMGGSISWLHTSGFNVTVWTTRVDGISASAADPSREGKFLGGKIGWKFGQHALAVDYSIHEDMAARGDEGKTYGIGYQWNPVRWFELYAQYRIFQLDRKGDTGTGVAAASTEDVSTASIGSRIRF